MSKGILGLQKQILLLFYKNNVSSPIIVEIFSIGGIMMKLMGVCILLVIVMPTMIDAKWRWSSDFAFVKYPQGIAIDSDGKIWICTDHPNDTLIPGDPSTAVYSLIILNPDGSPASFSPLSILSNSDGTIHDTLWNSGQGIYISYQFSFWISNSLEYCNILYSTFDAIYKIDYKTGTVLKKAIPLPGVPLIRACDYVPYFSVVSHPDLSYPVHVLDEDFKDYEYGAQNILGNGNAFSMLQPDWNTLLVSVSDHGPNGIRVYFSVDGFEGRYDCIDTVGTIFSIDHKAVKRNMIARSLDWGFHRVGNKRLIVSTEWNPDSESALNSEPNFPPFVVLDQTNGYVMIDSFGVWGGKLNGIPVNAKGDTIPPTRDTVYSTRGVAYPPNSKTIHYTADHDGGVIKKWEWDASPFAQGWWRYESTMPIRGKVNGIACDTHGDLWICYQGQNEIWSEAPELEMRSLAVLSFVHWSPHVTYIRTLTLPDGSMDTLYRPGNGIELSYDGYALYSCDDKLYKIDRMTMECVNCVQPQIGKPLAKAHSDRYGYTYVTTIEEGSPLYIFDKDFHEYGRVVESLDAQSHGLAVSPDGNDVYYAAIGGGNGIRHYHSDNGAQGPYNLVDTIGLLLNIDSTKLLPPISQIHMDRVNGRLWATVSNDHPLKGMYGIDPSLNYSVVSTIGIMLDGLGDSLGINKINNPCGVVIWEDWEAFTADCDNEDAPIKHLKKTFGADIHNHPESQLAANFSLNQNYPNPFNSSTTIPLTLKISAAVSLEIFDITGRRVASLLNQTMSPGDYRIPFDAGRRPTGIYLYILRINHKIEVKKMLHIK